MHESKSSSSAACMMYREGKNNHKTTQQQQQRQQQQQHKRNHHKTTINQNKKHLFNPTTNTFPLEHPKMIGFLCLICTFLLSQPNLAAAFQLIQSRNPLTSTISLQHNARPSVAGVTLYGKMNMDDEGDFGKAGGDSYEGDIDWDAEWKKVVENRDQPKTRPGQYKSDVERALLQTTKATGQQIKKVKIVKPDINIRSLQGDAKVG